MRYLIYMSMFLGGCSNHTTPPVVVPAAAAPAAVVAEAPPVPAESNEHRSCLLNGDEAACKSIIAASKVPMDLYKEGQQACSSNPPAGCYLAAQVLDGFEPDVEKQKLLNSVACNGGQGPACFVVAAFYFNGGNFAEGAAPKHLAALLKGCSADHGPSCFLLGSEMYNLGGTPDLEQRGLTFLRKACSLHVHDACIKLDAEGVQR